MDIVAFASSILVTIYFTILTIISIIDKYYNIERKQVKICNMIERKFNIGDEVSVRVKDNYGKLSKCIFGTIYGPVYGTNFYEIEAHNKIHYIFEEQEIERIKDIGGGNWVNVQEKKR